MPFTDRDVLCVGCGLTFVFSAGEQAFFRDRGFVNEPKHCKRCKAKRQGVAAPHRIETHVICSECGSDTQNRPIQANAEQTCAV